MKRVNTIEKYLDFYQDVPLAEYHLNEADYLYFSLLGYVHVDKVADGTSYADFCDLATASTEIHGYFAERSADIFKKFRNAKRYQNFVVNDYHYIVDDNTQFGVMTFALGKEAIVAFAGSDGSVIGWYENFRIGYDYPTYTQKLAQDYLARIEARYDHIAVLGHSKGGNLAVASAMGLGQDAFNKVTAIYNFDGPGFPKEIYDSAEYQRVQAKIVSFLPQDSYVGVLMYQGGKQKIVKATCKGINLHFQFNWIVYGGFLEEEEALSEFSLGIHTATTTNFDKVNKAEYQAVMEKAFASLEWHRKEHVKLGIKEVVGAIEVNQKEKIVTAKAIKDFLQTLLSRE